MRLLIVGGVAGGGSAAARARRLNEQASIVMFERGLHTSYANCGLPYYVGGEITNRDDLFLAGEEELKGWLNIDVRTSNEVLSIDRQNKRVEVRDLKSQKSYQEPYDYLILSPGAEPIRPAPLLAKVGTDHSRVLSLRSVADVDRIKEKVDEGIRTATIVGGGFIGLELAEGLVRKGVRITLVELLDQVMAVMDVEMVEPIHESLRKHGVDLRLGDSVSSLNPNGEAKLSVGLQSGKTIESDLVILAIGVRPDSGLAKEAGLALNDRGAIQVDRHMVTSDPYIYAVGDATEVEDPLTGGKNYVPLAGPANRQGRLAADHIMAREGVSGMDPDGIQYRGTLGSSVCRVFDVTVAATGKTQKALERAGKILHRDFEVIYVHPKDHAGYYPGATLLSVKVTFERPSGRVLGAQAVGEKGVEKRIDVLSMAIQKGATVFDLEEAELCYAPPFGSAKDPVNMAGFQGANLLRAQTSVVTPVELSKIAGKGDSKVLIVDVRKVPELKENGQIKGAIHIPLHELRDRLGELPKESEIVTYCRVGFRGYVAYRILKQHGFEKVKNLTGGLMSWKRHLKEPW